MPPRVEEAGASARIMCAACPAGTYAGSAGPWQCLLERESAFVADTCVMLRMVGCITTCNSNMRNMSADEPHEGSGGHLPSTAVRDYVRHVMRDLRDYLILVVHRQ